MGKRRYIYSVRVNKSDDKINVSYLADNRGDADEMVNREFAIAHSISFIGRNDFNDECLNKAKEMLASEYEEFK